jgi:hypothetical protein
LGARKREDHPKMGWSIHSFLPLFDKRKLSLPSTSFSPFVCFPLPTPPLTSIFLIPFTVVEPIHGKSCTAVHITLHKSILYYLRLKLRKHSLHKSTTSSFPRYFVTQRAAMCRCCITKRLSRTWLTLKSTGCGSAEG